MKKLLLLLVLILVPISVQAETIRSFVSDITLESDGSFSVSETIVYDFEDEERHGIFRFIPTKHFQESEEWFKERYLEIDNLSVSVDGEETPFERSENVGELEVKIGDPNRTISGEHTYIINYTVEGGLTYYDEGGVDLYWNATGDGWEVPIENALVRVYDIDGIALSEYRCYFGPSGSTEECPSVLGKGAYEFGPVSLGSNEGLTVALSLDPTLVDRLIMKRLSLWSLWLLGALVWFVWLVWFLYRYYVAHKTGASIIAQYKPYEDFKPMYTGLLFDGRIDPHDITAGIIYLAEQGFLKIKHIGRKKFFFIDTDDYEIELRRPYSEVETDFQKQIFTLLFREDATVGSVLVLSELAKDISQQKENFKVVTALKAAAEKDLVAKGFFEHKWNMPLKLALSLLIGLLILLTLTFLVGAEMASPIAIASITFVVSSVILALFYRRRTRKGYEALDYLKGFKLFLSVTDKERFAFHNAPKKSPEQFMEYLPYAIAFGVEKEWAKVFEGITIPTPSWYEDNTGGTFSALYLTNSLGTFSSSVASSGVSSSASSGGGSSGGGAGGGGGGSW
ncbi:DUF2207 domain-containing protein [Candidatus Nomurabacteria bacterium]|nr:DUF2207 domain-containing protein [Candidatus Nomurabacteria bacterium]MCB9819256.1 DUF2207 domain-containing protein [Candidatus Nomurabacteria bacterium]